MTRPGLDCALRPRMHDPAWLARQLDLASWRCTEPLEPVPFQRVRNELVLEHAKWDPQVGDVSVLTPFALVLPQRVWRVLAELAERLAAETAVAERALRRRADLIGRLGLPRRIARLLAQSHDEEAAPPAPRVLRFDFHPTAEGWRISEANCDVPGGYTEAASFPRLMAAFARGAAPAGDPAARLVEACLETMRGPGRVGLLAATGYMEDQQVTAYLAGLLRKRGCDAHRVHPRQVVWRRGPAHLDTAWYRGPLDLLVRFYQAEWAPEAVSPDALAFYFGAGRTPITNPGSSILAESKRFALVHEALGLAMPTWRALLPETRDPRTVDLRRDASWVLKTALCNTGDTVAIRGLTPEHAWRTAALGAALWPGHWLAQRRFEVLPLETPCGPRFLCLGVYTVNGQAAGLYGRIAARPIIDFQATDIAVLVAEQPRVDFARGQASDL